MVEAELIPVAVTPILTESEYFAFLAAQPENSRFELRCGELVPMSPTGYAHARRVSQLTIYLSRQLAADQYDILSGEAAIVLRPSPLTIRGMDVAVLPKPKRPISGALCEPVLLTIEVVSPSDSSIEVERKRMEYEAFGIREIWIVYEETRTVHVSQEIEERRHFIAAADASFHSVLGIEVHVGELFQ